MTGCGPGGLKLLARGGEADIYDCGDGRVLRVRRKPGGIPPAKEEALFRALQYHGVCVPRFYGITSADGKPAEIMEKISGETMMQRIARHPLRAPAEIRRLAAMQEAVFRVEAGNGLVEIGDIVAHFAGCSGMERELVDFVLSLFEKLPVEKCLCHGDFHPGNILIRNGGRYIIDWSGAYLGSRLSDIAHTYILMKHVPRVPGESRARHAFASFAGGVLADVYLDEFRKTGFDPALFSQWTVVMSFLRYCYGIPSETPERLGYIRKCYGFFRTGKDPSLWYGGISARRFIL